MSCLFKLFFVVAIFFTSWACCRKPAHTNQSTSTIQNASLNNVLYDLSWTLITLNNVPVQTDSGVKNPYMILTKGNNRVSGNGGCNAYSGNYTVEGTALHFGNFISTKMACDKLNLEYKFLKALKQCTQYQFVQDTLVLSDSLGENIARFKTIP